ncbi:hypothetical protein BH23BAC4_BH23BAC4_00700 [soil metagenome]
MRPAFHLKRVNDSVNLTTLIGLAAAACTTLAFLPQVVKNWKTRSVGDLSTPTFILFATGVFLWLIYGGLIRDLPLIAANTITLALVLTNLGQIVCYKRQRDLPS